MHHTDVRERALADFVPQRAKYAIVSNIPYYLSGFLLRSALSQEGQPDRVVFLVQKEVAERVAKSKKESLLSLSVKAYGEPRYVSTVGRGNFSPAPTVDSAILAIENISRKCFAGLDEAWFFKVLRAGFASRRKQLIGNLSALREREDILGIFQTLGIPPNARGEDLTIDRWHAVARALLLY